MNIYTWCAFSVGWCTAAEQSRPVNVNFSCESYKAAKEVDIYTARPLHHQAPTSHGARHRYLCTGDRTPARSPSRPHQAIYGLPRERMNRRGTKDRAHQTPVLAKSSASATQSGMQHRAHTSFPF
uniref:Uncharacterized protein n=1 Tax=Ixodes ricinus TaxID=34613 RepID=A0A6B0UPS3_IXORI